MTGIAEQAKMGPATTISDAIGFSRRTEGFISIGDEVDLCVREGAIVIEPTKRIHNKHNLKELIKKIPENYEAGEVNWGPPSGREVW